MSVGGADGIWYVEGKGSEAKAMETARAAAASAAACGSIIIDKNHPVLF
jgi:hypothetical protein